MREVVRKPRHKGKTPCAEEVRKVNKIFTRAKEACLPCRRRKIRCTGKGPPCGTCTARKSENECEFAITANPKNTAPDAPQVSSRGDQPQIWKPNDLTAPPSPASSEATLSELSQTPSLVSYTDEDVDAEPEPSGTLFEQPRNVLPSWDMVDKLIERYFASVFPLFGTFPSSRFKEEYIIFRRNPDLANHSWLSMLFAILSLACQAEAKFDRGRPYERLSMSYENAACKCLSIDDPQFESLTSALQAVMLIIYGRIHRGDDVSKDLCFAYGMAKSMSCQQCATQPLACEEHQIHWVGLKVLFAMNSQVYSSCRNQDVSRSIHLLAVADKKQPVDELKLLMSSEATSILETTFTMLQFHILKMSDTIAMSIQNGLFSSRSLRGVTDELSRLKKFCADFCAELGPSDSNLEFWKGRVDILQYAIQYLFQCVYKPYLEKYLDGDTTFSTKLAATKCIGHARATSSLLSSLVANEHLRAFTWYFRGFGKHYAAVSEGTLASELEGIRTEDKAREASYFLFLKERPGAFLGHQK
ncbi:hypothetical protein N7476_000347 [Penicillium atrosanguineum]|uniref:Zn(2)-C6 fungal-type domain-containing protein n=1 Tax=Penicillium atrosanguineum TaxID=1132637 RepID=A0A9W9QCR8_9EURO|nr:hypothetical protein N7476_000347 [Penicillium atrosanguineum]